MKLATLRIVQNGVAYSLEADSERGWSSPEQPQQARACNVIFPISGTSSDPYGVSAVIECRDYLRRMAVVVADFEPIPDEPEAVRGRVY